MNALTAKPAPVCEAQFTLSTQQLQVAWPKLPQRLRLPDLSLRPGEQRAFTPSSETTAFFATLAGLLCPLEGSLHFLGESVNLCEESSSDRLRIEGVGTVFGFSQLHYTLSPLENVTLACRYASGKRRRAEKASGNVRKSALSLLKALGFDLNLIHHAIRNLPTAECQRLLLARALLGAPPLVIVDALLVGHALEHDLLMRTKALSKAQNSTLLYAPRAYSLKAPASTLTSK